LHKYIKMSVHTHSTRMTTTRIRGMKGVEKITMLTSYDYTLARLADEAGVDTLLVGDSASNIVCGNQYTLPITVDEMIFLAKGVVRAAQHALVVVDMPFGSYQVNDDEAVRNAIRMVKESGADAVKLEGGREIADAIRRMVVAGVPVCGHLGLTPQSVNQLGGYGLRAKEEAEAEKLIADAKLLDEAGCFCIVLEKIPAALAERVTKAVSCPTIGIGAGAGTDGQVLVLHDMLGLNEGFKPKFLRQFAHLAEDVHKAVGEYVTTVKDGSFPSAEESY